MGDILRELIPEGTPPDIFYEKMLPGWWPQIVGHHLSNVSMPGRLQGGALIVWVSSARWKDALSGLEGDILARLQKRLPPGMIRSVSIRVQSGRFSRNPVVSPGGQGREEESWVQECAAPIGNDELRKAFLKAIQADLAGDALRDEPEGTGKSGAVVEP